MNRVALGVNIDHIATLREARGTRYPDPVYAAALAEEAGADAITLHLREDRRHIQERDVWALKETLNTRMNLEMAVTQDMVSFAETVVPEDCCLVPERREELTTEGGLDVVTHRDAIAQACVRLSAAGIRVSLFIDPDLAQIEAAVEVGAPVIELHTGTFALASGATQAREWQRLAEAARVASALGLAVNAGHGLHYHNAAQVAALPEIRELNIGHAIVARAVFAGLREAVATMRSLLAEARQ